MWKTAPLIPRFLYIYIYIKFLIFHIIVRVFVSKKSISSCDEKFFMNTRISPYEFSRKLHFHPPKKRAKNNKKVSFNVIYTKTCPMYSLMWRIATTTTLRPPSTWKHFVNAFMYSWPRFFPFESFSLNIQSEVKPRETRNANNCDIRLRKQHFSFNKKLLFHRISDSKCSA